MGTKQSGIKRALVTFLSFSLLLSAQLFASAPQAKAAISTATVSGKVIDSVTSLPLAAVTVSDDAATSPATTTTDAAGHYALTVPIGDHVLSVKLSGYVTSNSALFTAVSGDALTMNFSLVRYASASGLVTADGTTTGVGSVVVKLFDAAKTDLNPVITATTASNGQWSLTSIVPGTYKVQFDGSGTDYMSRWFDGKSTRDEATQVLVAPGAVLSLSGSLVQGAKISGTVKDVHGNPIVGASIYVSGSPGRYGYATTDSSGKYEVRGLAADQYLVEAQKSGYAATWMGGADDQSTASYISVPAAASIQNADIVMQVGGVISGTVGPAGAYQGSAGFGESVQAFRDGFPYNPYYGSVSTTDGSYSITQLPPGRYRVLFSTDYASYYQQYYQNADSAATATLVTVTTGSTITAINAVLAVAPVVPSDPAVVMGQIVDLDNAPLAGVLVRARTSGVQATTDATGSFVMTASVRDSTLDLSKTGYAATSVSVWPGSANTSTNPFKVATVSLSRVSTITGKVTSGPSNAPTANTYVRATLIGGGGTSATWTASDGTYSIPGLAEGSYVVSADPSADYVQTYYDGAAVSSLARYVTVGQGLTATGIDIHRGKAASVSGSVRRADGSAAGSASVTIVAYGYTRTISTGADGGFTFGGLPTGRYVVSATEGGSTVWWNGAGSRTGASNIDVSGDDVSGVTLTLPSGYTLSGTLTDSGGQVMASTRMYLLSASGQQTQATSSATGEYAFHGVAAGTYKLGVLVGYSIVWLPGTYSSSLAATFDVAADRVLDVKFPSQATVSVHLSGADRTVPSPATVIVYDANQSWVTYADVNGGSGALQLYPGSYEIVASAAGYVETTRSITVTAATTIDITLPVGGKISVALAGAGQYFLSARNLTTGEAFLGDTTESTYAFTGLPDGDYVISAIAAVDGSTCGKAVWHGGSNYFDATPVHVTDGSVVSITLAASCGGSVSGHSISGSLVLPAGVALTDTTRWNVYLTATNVETNEEFGTYTPTSTGTFTLNGLRPGTYLVDLTADSSLNLGEASLTVTIGAADVTGVSLVVPAAGSIKGHVVNSFGHGVQYVTVSASGTDGGESASTDAKGDFTITGLRSGDYVVIFSAPSPLLGTTLEAVHVAIGAATTIPTVALQNGGRIAGVIPSGTGSVLIEAMDSSGAVLTRTNTYDGGDYLLGVVPAGATYVRFSGSGIVSEWWKDAATLGTATPVTVTTNQAVAGISPMLTTRTPSATVTSISGKITGPKGPLSGIWVYASGLTTNEWSSDNTAADGTYTLEVPVGETYTVEYDACFGYGDVSGCLNDHYSESRTVPVGTSPVTNVNFVIVPPSMTFTTAPVPTIAGMAASGQTLTATAGTWAPIPDALAYQWYADGTAIPAGTQPTFQLADAQLGKKITVTVTATKAGYTTKTVTSDPTTAVTAAPQSVGGVTPTITGSAAVSYTLTAVPGSWTPTGVTFAYQWRRDGVDIQGATGSSYSLVPADAGHHLAVAVTGSKSGYVSATLVSAPTALVTSATSALAYEAFVKGSYMDFLGREATAAEVSTQSKALASGTVSKESFLSTLANSDEWLSAIVTKMYKDTLGRAPDAAGLSSWVSWLRSGRFSVAQAASLFYASDEYYLYHAGGTPTSWVTALYTKLLGRDPDAAGLQYWVAKSTDPGFGKSRVAYEFYQSTESRLHRVLNLYQALLARDPDPTGWPFWAQQVYTTGDIVLATNLANSTEYWLRAHQRY
jgi:hypothetical protein